MKAKIKVEKEVDIRSVEIDIQPRYVGDSSDDDMASDFPLLDATKTYWVASVNTDTGQVANWPIGQARKAYCKVCDAGIYTLIDADGNCVARRADYVPNKLIPGEYGDYIDLDIDANGFIANWPNKPDISVFPKDDA